MGADGSAQEEEQMENYHIPHTLKLSTGNHRDPRREEAMVASTLSLMPRRSGCRPWLAPTLAGAPLRFQIWSPSLLCRG